MSTFDTEFMMELFLDDNVSTMNRLIVATANAVNENLQNISHINRTLIKEQSVLTEPSNSYKSFKNISIPYVNKYFFERTVKNFTNEEYILNFKMTKVTVQALIAFLKEHFKPGSSIVPLDKKIHVFLWALVNDCSFKEVGNKFGLHKSSVSYIFHEITTLLAEQRYQFINWPSLEEQHITRVKVNSRYGFPNCVGFIDACRLKVGSKRKRREVTDTILLQAVCDETLMFIDIHIGEIGNTGKGKLFRETQLSQELKNFIDFDNHILGDSEYKLRKNILTPFTSDELLTCEEERFNELHWKTHTYISSAFDILKDRFRKLNHIDINKPESIQTLICAACVLHNFVLLHEGRPVKEETVINEEGVSIDTNVVKSAAEKRQFICNGGAVACKDYFTPFNLNGWLTSGFLAVGKLLVGGWKIFLTCDLSLQGARSWSFRGSALGWFLHELTPKSSESQDILLTVLHNGCLRYYRSDLELYKRHVEEIYLRCQNCVASAKVPILT